MIQQNRIFPFTYCRSGLSMTHVYDHVMRHSLHLLKNRNQTYHHLSGAANNDHEVLAIAILKRLDIRAIDVGNICSPMKGIFSCTVPSFLISDKVMVWAAISSKELIAPIYGHGTITAGRKLDICVNFRRYKMPCRTVGTRCGLCKTVSVHIE